MLKLNYRKIALMLADIFIILISGIVIDWVTRIFDGLSGHNFNMGDKALFVVIGSNAIFCFIILWISGAYVTLWRYSKIKDYSCCVLGMAGGTLLTSAVFWMLSENLNFEISILFIVLTSFVGLIGIILFRLIFRNAFIVIRDHEQNMIRKRIMIIGGEKPAKYCLKKLKTAERMKKILPATITLSALWMTISESFILK